MAINVIKLHTGPIQTNTYLFECGSQVAVVDPGADAAKISAAAEKIGKPAGFVLLTHAHWDHTGAAAALQALGAKVFISAADAALLDYYFKRGVAPFVPDARVYDGDVLDLNGVKVKVLLTSGHSAGSACYLTDGVMFSGDTLFRLEVGRCDLPTGDFDAMKQSLKKLFALEKDYRVLPGHGEETALFFERDNNPYRNE